ncbi:MAG: hypothetical protein WD669_13465 [Pirellulales bacterium]
MPQRSPVLIGVLFAATLAVDAVASYWFAHDMFQALSLSLFIALALSQVSVVCVWAVFTGGWAWLRATAPFVFAFAAAVAPTIARGKWPWNQTDDFLLNFTAQLVLDAAVVLVALWVVRQFLWQRISHRTADVEPLRFSLLQVLAVMTVTAFVLTLLNATQLLHDGRLALSLLFIAVNVALVLFVVVAYGVSGSYWPFWLAGSLGLAVILGKVEALFGAGFVTIDWPSINLIQVVVLWTWIYLARLVPRGSETSTSGAQQTILIRPDLPE